MTEQEDRALVDFEQFIKNGEQAIKALREKDEFAYQITIGLKAFERLLQGSRRTIDAEKRVGELQEGLKPLPELWRPWMDFD